MIKKEYLLILILVIIILAIGIAIFNQITVNNNTILGDNNAGADYEMLTDNSSDDPGTVHVIRNIGNPNSKKIAYVVGVHPLENETHKTLLKILPTLTNLDYCYDIYVINVTEDIGHYGDGYSDNSPGRQNGQNLALEYVYPEIKDGDYELAIDVHSNIGAYPYKTFVFSPVNDSLSVDYAHEVADDCKSISYYSPESTTSGPYLTIPLNKNGIPAFYFEEYSFAPQNEKDSHMLDLIYAVDSLNFE